MSKNKKWSGIRHDNQGTYIGNHEEEKHSEWICPNDETVNTGAYCVICGFNKPGLVEERRVCDSCGYQNNYTAYFCGGCGKKFVFRPKWYPALKRAIAVIILVSVSCSAYMFGLNKNYQLAMNETGSDAIAEMASATSEQEYPDTKIIIAQEQMETSNTSINKTIPLPREAGKNGEDVVIEQGQEATESSAISTQAPQVSSNVMMSTYDYLGASDDYNTDHMHELEEAMSQKPFWGQGEIRRKEISKVVFLDALENKGEDYWDVSEAGDESVIAWEEDGVLYVAADGVISLSRSALGMFSSFTNLKEIEFNDNIDTSQVTDMQDMFLGCWNLQEINLSCFDTSNVTSMSSMFGSTSIQQLDVSTFDTTNVVSLAGMFANCENLQYLDLSNFNTAKLESMSSVFANCCALSYVDLSSFNTGNVDDMNGLFYRCYSLKELDLSGFDTAKVKDMSWMFAACKMSQLDISRFKTDSLENTTGMFRNSSIDVLRCNSNTIQRAYDNR